jgi:hypothetical protein
MKLYYSVQLIGYADNASIMGRTKRGISEVHKKLRERSKAAGFNISAEKNKSKCTKQENK